MKGVRRLKIERYLKYLRKNGYQCIAATKHIVSDTSETFSICENDSIRSSESSLNESGTNIQVKRRTVKRMNKLARKSGKSSSRRSIRCVSLKLYLS